MCYLKIIFHIVNAPNLIKRIQFERKLKSEKNTTNSLAKVLSDKKLYSETVNTEKLIFGDVNGNVAEQ